MNSWKNFKFNEWEEKDDVFDHKSFERVFNEAVKSCKGKIEKLAKATKNIIQPPWKPNVWYNKEGDQIEVCLSTEDHYAKWITPEIDLLLSHETNEIIGIQINGVKQVLKDKK